MKGAQRGCPQPSLLPFELTPVLLKRCGHRELVHCGATARDQSGACRSPVLVGSGNHSASASSQAR